VGHSVANKSYPADLKLRAVVLAEATSLEDASRKLGIPKDTIARWMALAPDQSALERAHDLAMSEMTAKMAAGETRGIRDLAVVAGIMRDKIARYGKAQPEQIVPDWGERLDAWVDATYPPDLRPLARRAITRQLSDELHEIETAPGYVPDNTPLDRDPEADAQLFDGFRAFLEGIPDLVPWHEAWELADRERRAQREAQAAADLARYHEIGMRVRYCVENTGKTVAGCIAEAQQPLRLDADTLALIEQAEAVLAKETP
jgi:transposase-like protein